MADTTKKPEPASPPAAPKAEKTSWWKYLLGIGLFTTVFDTRKLWDEVIAPFGAMFLKLLRLAKLEAGEKVAAGVEWLNSHARRAFRWTIFIVLASIAVLVGGLYWHSRVTVVISGLILTAYLSIWWACLHGLVELASMAVAAGRDTLSFGGKILVGIFSLLKINLPEPNANHAGGVDKEKLKQLFKSFFLAALMTVAACTSYLLIVPEMGSLKYVICACMPMVLILTVGFFMGWKFSWGMKLAYAVGCVLFIGIASIGILRVFFPMTTKTILESHGAADVRMNSWLADPYLGLGGLFWMCAILTVLALIAWAYFDDKTAGRRVSKTLTILFGIAAIALGICLKTQERRAMDSFQAQLGNNRPASVPPAPTPNGQGPNNLAPPPVPATGTVKLAPSPDSQAATPLPPPSEGESDLDRLKRMRPILSQNW